MSDALITATAATHFGRHADRTLIDLAVTAGREALETAGVTATEVDALYLGNFLGQSLQHQGVLASLVARRLGLETVPTTTVEGACASAGIALRHGVLAVRARAADIVLCIGAEHLTGVDVATVTGGLAEATDQQTDGAAGLTFPGFFGLVAHAHAGRYGTTREQLAAVPVKNRRHGAANPLAMFRDPVTSEQVMQSRLIADPLRLYDCSPIADGAAAAVVASSDAATITAGRPVRVLACEQASGPTQIAHIDDLTTFPATRAAAARAYQAADVAPSDVDVVELHDCFSIAEIVDSEDLGLLPPGEAAEAIAVGATTLDGEGLVINPSGGLIARGHPVGATGLAQVHELVNQLRGTARNAVDGPRVALAHNLGGCGATATVTILTS